MIAAGELPGEKVSGKWLVEAEAFDKYKVKLGEPAEVEYHTTVTAAKELGISPARIRKLIALGDIEAEKVSGKWHINVDSISEYRRYLEEEPQQDWYSTAEVAKELGITRSKVYGLLSNEAIKGEKVGNSWRIDISSISSYKEQLESAAKAEKEKWLDVDFSEYTRPYMTVSEASGLLGLGESKVRSLLKDQTVAGAKYGSTWLIDTASLREYTYGATEALEGYYRAALDTGDIKRARTLKAELERRGAAPDWTSGLSPDFAEFLKTAKEAATSEEALVKLGVMKAPAEEGVPPSKEQEAAEYVKAAREQAEGEAVLDRLGVGQAAYEESEKARQVRAKDVLSPEFEQFLTTAKAIKVDTTKEQVEKMPVRGATELSPEFRDFIEAAKAAPVKKEPVKPVKKGGDTRKPGKPTEPSPKESTMLLGPAMEALAEKAKGLQLPKQTLFDASQLVMDALVEETLKRRGPQRGIDKPVDGMFAPPTGVHLSQRPSLREVQTMPLAEYKKRLMKKPRRKK